LATFRRSLPPNAYFGIRIIQVSDLRKKPSPRYIFWNLHYAGWRPSDETFLPLHILDLQRKPSPVTYFGICITLVGDLQRKPSSRYIFWNLHYSGWRPSEETFPRYIFLNPHYSGWRPSEETFLPLHIFKSALLRLATFRGNLPPVTNFGIRITQVGDLQRKPSSRSN
jgi:hypothetical protein